MSAAIVAVLSLRATMWVYGVEMRDTYQALIIIVALMALMLLPGKGRKDDVTNQFLTVSISVFSRWGLLLAMLLLLGYATKTSSIFSRKTLFT